MEKGHYIALEASLKRDSYNNGREKNFFSKPPASKKKHNWRPADPGKHPASEITDTNCSISLQKLLGSLAMSPESLGVAHQKM